MPEKQTVMTDAEFDRIYRFLKERYGVDMRGKKEIVNGRMENFLRTSEWDSYTAFMDAIEADESGELEKSLVDMLTTNHTFFMREAEHFEYLRDTVLPWIRKKEENTRDVRIWCGASSTGEEPYAIAMVLADFFGLEFDKWDTQVLATDISEHVLRQAIAGIYSAEQIDALPETWRRRFFRRKPGEDFYQATDELKKQVLFRKFNLMEPFPFHRKMHVIFLRNVMIYFDDRTKAELIRKVYDTLEPGGYLFIGRTETLDRGSTPFTMIKPSIFKK
ncbi:MAG: protein-glutamate O-methyltransferase CheR [Clostridiales bacterium]|nr:protein-glutamate O-methyltransferase CheR [Clostridiales bacterium]